MSSWHIYYQLSLHDSATTEICEFDIIVYSKMTHDLATVDK